MNHQRILVMLLLFTANSHLAAADRGPAIIFESEEMHHLRAGETREWSTFPAQAAMNELRLEFDDTVNASSCTLRLRQQDVKQRWTVSLNEKKLGELRQDENDMLVYFEIPPKLLKAGLNVLTVKPASRDETDDIRVGSIAIDRRAKDEILNEATIDIKVVDATSQLALPSRITIVRDGVLQTSGAQSDSNLAVRPGTVYTSNGSATIGLPAGSYTIYAGRGFEYSLDSVNVTLTHGLVAQETLSIRREVPTPNYIACDPHVHTLTHSGHGDATVLERMITLAAEGIELPVATDHNVQIDHEPFAIETGVRQYFTPVIGNEVTTKVGHFNVFPIDKGAIAPNHRLTQWESIFADIYKTPGVRVAILNHGRDLHSGVRPLGPKFHNPVVGENIKGWQPGMNAMEVINSSATQSRPFQLIHDWMTFLNRGVSITPIGSSDSHDVARHFVGQGRTYIRCDDSAPGNIDVGSAVDSLLKGRVSVSYGLLVEMRVSSKAEPGDLAVIEDKSFHVDLRVLGPHWVSADKIQLFANGQLVQEQAIKTNPNQDRRTGVLWQDRWQMQTPKHDVHLVAVASGPGIDKAYWKTAKPYQPTSTNWESRIIGCTGAVWIDADGDGQRTSAREYAERLVADSQGKLPAILSSLENYDQAVIAQTAHLYQTSERSLLKPDARRSLKQASPVVQAGVARYVNAWRRSQEVP